jgi:hypothetical protein
MDRPVEFADSIQWPNLATIEEVLLSLQHKIYDAVHYGYLNQETESLIRTIFYRAIRAEIHSEGFWLPNGGPMLV